MKRCAPKSILNITSIMFDMDNLRLLRIINWKDEQRQLIVNVERIKIM